jgi:hypothetical protein
MANGDRGSFWTTLPGVLTSTATLITALVGLYVAVTPKQQPTTTGPLTSDSQPFFMVRPVTADDLKGKSTWDLDVMRNEIYARYGRTFQRRDLQQYFESKSWYKPRYGPGSFPANLLTRVQQANVDAIIQYQHTVSP